MFIWMLRFDGFGLIPIFEILAFVIIFIIVFYRPQLSLKGLSQISRIYAYIACRRRLAVVLVGLAALLEGLLVLLVYMPEPRIHDEFSYLLAAETFAAGRLTNPPHPMRLHFESPHILHHPTYMSKFPPAQGIMLAIGKLTTGYPIVGVKLSFALACAAICWMLQGWLPLQWAFLGGLLAVGRFGGFGYWSQSYWGAAVAVVGGALVYGALRRIMRQQRMRDALLMGVGWAVLANSRPFEGLIVSLPAAVALLVWMLGKNRPSLSVTVCHIIFPIFVVLALTGGAMAIYNLHVSGNIFLLPYQAYEMSQDNLPHVSLDFVGTRQMHSISGFVSLMLKRCRNVWFFYLGLLLTIPLVVALWRKDRWTRFALLACGMLMVLFLIETWFQPHYAAPATGLVLLLVLQGMRHIRLWQWRGLPSGQLLVRTLLISFVLSFVFIRWLQLEWVLNDWYRLPKPWNFYRAQIRSQLEEKQGNHLVIIRYGSKHRWIAEWVYNQADIDASKVVWAHDLNESQNRQLVAYFKDRQIWVLDADTAPPKLTPYANETTPTSRRSY